MWVSHKKKNCKPVNKLKHSNWLRLIEIDWDWLKFIEIDRKVYSADNLVETFAVTISDEIFEKLKKRNRKISIRGKVYDWVVTIPKEVATTLDDYTKKKYPQ